MCKVREGFCLTKSRYRSVRATLDLSYQRQWPYSQPKVNHLSGGWWGGVAGTQWWRSLWSTLSYHSIYLRKTLTLKGNRHLIQDTQGIKSKLRVEGRPDCLGISDLLTVTFPLCSCSQGRVGRPREAFCSYLFLFFLNEFRKAGIIMICNLVLFLQFYVSIKID